MMSQKKCNTRLYCDSVGNRLIKDNDKKGYFFVCVVFDLVHFFFTYTPFFNEAFNHHIIYMVDRRETDQFLSNERRKSSPRSAKCHTRWWNQEYDHQKFICGINESFPFHALIIFLVILDTSLVISEIMLDSFKIQHECKSHMNHPSKHLHDKTKERIIHAMEIVHYCSIGILSFFFVELLVRIYAQGKEFWNIRRKKMEYLDAFIVITSLIIDLLFLTGEQKLLGEKLLLILVFRLWRFIRIISSTLQILIFYLLKANYLI
jgi:hypothetical protein